MNERPEQEDYDEEADLDSGEDVDQVIRDFDTSRRRGAPKPSGDPAWRRLERLREEKHTADLISDFDDYDIGLEGAGGARSKRASQR
ncbi:MAG: hypothetical protein ACKOGN_03890 [Gammaproteobacteria bacterium]|jgi:hypothetical protein|nr:hypothetical protein [Gammaproteobacteria bacterium]